MKEAEVWIVDGAMLNAYREYCELDAAYRAEPPSFMQECIKEGRLIKEYILPKRAMRGRWPGP